MGPLGESPSALTSPNAGRGNGDQNACANGGASGSWTPADTTNRACNANRPGALDQVASIDRKEGVHMNEQTDTRRDEDQHQHHDKVTVRMGLDANTLDERSRYTVPMMFDRFRGDDGMARFEVNVVINGVLLAQVMISQTEVGPATVTVFDAADLETAPICPSCDAGDPTNPFPCECGPTIEEGDGS